MAFRTKNDSCGVAVVEPRPFCMTEGDTLTPTEMEYTGTHPPSVLSLCQWTARALAVTALYGTLCAAPAALAEQSDLTPVGQVRSTVNQLRHILRQLEDPSEIHQRRGEVEQVVRRHVNYGQMAKRSLGDGWNELNEGQQEEFVGLFVQMLRDSLASRMCRYADQQIHYLSERQISRFATVATRLVGNKIDMSIDFRLEDVAGQWLLYDAIIDGVSIVSNYRAQFAAIMREGSYAALLSSMKRGTLLVKLYEKDACS